MDEATKIGPPEPIAPVSVTIVGTGDGSIPIEKGLVAVTPDHQPNLVVNVVSPLVALAVRFGNVYGTVLLGLLGAAVTPSGAHILGAGDFGHLLENCASLSLAPAVIDLIKNLVTIFGRLESKYPLLTGSV